MLQYSVLAKGNSGGALPYSWTRGHANHPGMFLKNMRSTEMGFPFFFFLNYFPSQISVNVSTQRFLHQKGIR